MGNDSYSSKERLIKDGSIDEKGNILNPERYATNKTPRSGEFLIIASLDNTIVEY